MKRLVFTMAFSNINQDQESPDAIAHRKILNALEPLQAIAWVLSETLQPVPKHGLKFEEARAMAETLERMIDMACDESMELNMAELVPIAYARMMAVNCAPPMPKPRRQPRARVTAL
jgi:hypothetical protein